MKYRQTFREALKDVGKNDSEKVAQLKTKIAKEKDTDTLEKQIVVLQNQIGLLKAQLENEKNNTIKPEPNPDTGEVPLRTGVAQAILDRKGPMPKIKKDRQKKIKLSGKSEIKINPELELGIASGGNNVGSGSSLN